MRDAYPDTRPWRQRALSRIDELSIHHTVSPNREWTKEEEYSHLQFIYDGHTTLGRFKEGWTAPGIGYWFLAFPSGRVYQVGSLTDQRASVGWQNHHIVGVALVGSYESETPSALLLESVKQLRLIIESELGRTLAVRPHSHWSQTACPGDWNGWGHLL